MVTKFITQKVLFIFKVEKIWGSRDLFLKARFSRTYISNAIISWIEFTLVLFLSNINLHQFFFLH